MDKSCTKCKETKDESNFHKNCKEKDGLAHWCKTCSKVYADRYYKLNRESKLAYQKSSEYRTARRTWRTGWSETDFDSQYLKQGGDCAICSRSITKFGTSKVAADHCHGTGKIRDLLCSNCNVGLGNFRDNPDLLERAYLYLKKHQCA